MIKKSIIPLKKMVFFSILMFSCDFSNINEEFRLNNTYWNLSDYSNAVSKIRYSNIKEQKPSYSNPETRLVFEKIIDQNNILVVVNDSELGLKHKVEYTEKMFGHYQVLTKVYSKLNREDKYVYPREFVDLLSFGLFLQLHYFDLGNQNIIQQSDNPNSSSAKSNINANVQTLISNYNIYLNIVKQEHSLNEEALDTFVIGINTYFYQLIEKYPKANYHEMKIKAQNMRAKTNSKKVEKALQNLVDKIEMQKKQA